MMTRLYLLHFVRILCFALPLSGESLLHNYDFQVITVANQKGELGIRTIRGNERKNNSQNRLSMISESQMDYPNPESGCGPVALLNTLVWYQKYGLISPIFSNADPVDYKQKLFAEIDRRIAEKSGSARDEHSGSRNMDIVMVLDEIVQEQSAGKLRVHFDFMESPLKLRDLLETMPNFRTGYLLGYPKHPDTRELMSLHAVTLIRVDRAGYLTIGTWGEKYRGLLRARGTEQWFIPQAPHNVEIKILGLMRFIPFEPIVDGND